MKRIQKLVEVIGAGVALGCIVWVLGHLLAFDFIGYFMVGESNKLILYGEIALVFFGLICFIKTFFQHLIKTNQSGR